MENEFDEFWDEENDSLEAWEGELAEPADEEALKALVIAMVNQDNFEAETVVLGKEGKVAVLALQVYPEGGGGIMQLDPRNNEPQTRFSQDTAEIRGLWEEALRESVRNGWTIGNRGLPNIG